MKAYWQLEHEGLVERRQGVGRRGSWCAWMTPSPPFWEVTEVSLEDIILAYLELDDPLADGPLAEVGQLRCCDGCTGARSTSRAPH
jgi:hypothetical protein